MREEIRDKYREPELPPYEPKSSDVARTIIALIGLGLIAYFVAAVESGQIMNDNKEYDTHRSPRPRGQVHEKNYSIPSIVRTDDADIIEMPDKSGNMTQVKLTADTISVMHNLLEDNYLRNQKAEIELREENQKNEQTQKVETATRRRRVDKYKNAHDNSDSINV